MVDPIDVARLRALLAKIGERSMATHGVRNETCSGCLTGDESEFVLRALPALLAERTRRSMSDPLDARALLATVLNDGALLDDAVRALRPLLDEREALREVVKAAKRHARVLHDWDADSNVLPLAPECAAGTCDATARCGDGSKPGANEYDHAEAHFLDSLARTGETT